MTAWVVERLGRRGDGVAVSGNQRALAPLTLPGETIEGQADAGRIATSRILTPSADRVRPVCGHYRTCGGCSLMHASDAFNTGWKEQVVINALAAQDITADVESVHVSPPRSRRRAVLSGRRTKKGAQVGFHARASDQIVDLADCHVMRRQITDALPLLRRIVAAGASRSAPVSMTVIHGPAGLDVAVSGGKPMEPVLFQTLAALAEAGDLARLDWDGETLTRRPPALPMGTARVVPPPGVFLQATTEGEAALCDAVLDFTKGASRIVDLYAGCGTFTLPLASHFPVHAVEGLQAPLTALDAGWRSTPALHRVTTESRDLARRPLLPADLAEFDTIVIDPPRAGAAAQVAQIVASKASRVIYVACDPVNFAKDVRVLTEGGFCLTRLRIVDQFRWSPHVEMVAQLLRR